MTTHDRDQLPSDLCKSSLRPVGRRWFLRAAAGGAAAMFVGAEAVFGRSLLTGASEGSSFAPNPTIVETTSRSFMRQAQILNGWTVTLVTPITHNLHTWTRSVSHPASTYEYLTYTGTLSYPSRSYSKTIERYDEYENSFSWGYSDKRNGNTITRSFNTRLLPAQSSSSKETLWTVHTEEDTMAELPVDPTVESMRTLDGGVDPCDPTARRSQDLMGRIVFL